MIIQRKYEWLGVLYENDPLSRSAIDNAFAIHTINEKQKEELLQCNHNCISEFFDLGCGIPWECYKDFMNQFEKLDKTNPYDNGLSFSDVTKIEYETSRKGSAIQMRFVSEPFDSPYRIVGFAALENNAGSVIMNRGWTMAAPYMGSL